MISHFAQIRTLVDPNAVIGGLSAGWRAPVGVFSAPCGFGEAAWISAIPTTTLAMHLSGETVVSRTPSCHGRRSHRGHSLALQPSGSTNASTCDGPVTFAHIYIPDDLLDRVAAELGHSAMSGALRDDLWFFEDHELESLAAVYVDRSQATTSAPTRLEMEARSMLLLERLVTRHRPVQPSRMLGGLAPWAMKKVVSHLSDNPGSNFGIAALADLVGLSPFHFARMFKRSTGLPPHAFQRRLRSQRARELLETTDMPIGDVANAVGHETPQAFARMFRDEVGASPSAYRRARRG